MNHLYLICIYMLMLLLVNKRILLLLLLLLLLVMVMMKQIRIVCSITIIYKTNVHFIYRTSFCVLMLQVSSFIEDF